MAFNPFHGFRKHSKVIFAILTIICMLTFVLAGNFRGGDALDWIVSKFGGKSRQGPVVATLYGDDVRENPLNQQGYERKLANDFMQIAVLQGVRNTMAEIRKEVIKPVPKDAGKLVLDYRNAIRTAFLEDAAFGGGDPEKNGALKQLFANAPDPKKARDAALKGAMQRKMMAFQSPGFQEILARERKTQLLLLRFKLREKQMNREAQFIAGLILEQDAEVMWPLGGRIPRPNSSFFDNSTKRQDLLDERVWWRQADHLGLAFTEADIRAEVNRVSPAKEILTSDNGENAKLLRSFFARERYKDVDVATLYRALGNELRASMAQGIVLGQEPGFRGLMRNVYEVPAAISPAEFVRFYKEQRTTLKVTLLPIAVESFVSDELPSPKERELRAFYERYKNDAPKPWSNTPGFKEPQRVALEWISLENPSPATYQKIARAFPAAGFLREMKDPREQHYLKVAEKFFQSQYNTRNPSGFLGAAGLPIPLATLATPRPLAPWIFLNATHRIDRAHEALKSNFPVPTLLQGDPAYSYYTALNLPTMIASTAGMMAPNGSQACLFNAILTFQGAAIDRGRKYQATALKAEAQKRARVVGGLVLASLGPALTRPSPWAWADNKEEPLTRKEKQTWIPGKVVLDPYVSKNGLRFQVLDEASANLARDLQKADVERLTKAIKDAKGNADAVKKAVSAALKLHPWLKAYYGKSDHAVDQYTLATARRYRPLLSGGSDTRPTLTERMNNASRYFTGTKVFDPKEESGILYWKTKDEPAKTPGFTEARAQVLKAWRLQEARKLARKKAVEIRARVTGKSPAEALKILRGIAEQPTFQGTHLIHLDKVSPQVPVEDENPEAPKAREQTQPTRYVPYKPPEEDLSYPPANFVSQLLELKEHKAGIIADRPMKHFYVVYVEKRTVPLSARDVLARTFPGLVAREIKENNLWKLLEKEKREEFRKAALKELRRQAGKLDARGRFALRPGLKSDEGSSNAPQE